MSVSSQHAPTPPGSWSAVQVFFSSLPSFSGCAAAGAAAGVEAAGGEALGCGGMPGMPMGGMPGHMNGHMAAGWVRWRAPAMDVPLLHAPAARQRRMPLPGSLPLRPGAFRSALLLRPAPLAPQVPDRPAQQLPGLPLSLALPTLPPPHTPAS